MRALPIWRSMLFVPALNEKFIAGAPSRGADAIQIDLEDSIPAPFKQEARARVAGAAAELAGKGCDVVVRINRAWRLAVPDLEASVSEHVRAINLPKVPNAAHVRAIGEVLDELETERGLEPGYTAIVAMVETAEGLIAINEIASASPRVVALTVGAEDLALSMGIEPVEDALYVPNVQGVIAARAAGILPIGYVGTVAQYADRVVYRQTIERARRLGFAGGFAIHPDQVPILNEAFSPTAKEVADARALIAAYDEAAAEGRGALAHGGVMIDQPVVDRARRLVAAHAAIAARTAT